MEEMKNEQEQVVQEPRKDEEQFKAKMAELEAREKAIEAREKAVEKSVDERWNEDADIRKTRMVKPIKKGTRMVKVRALRPIKVTTHGNKSVTLQPGDVAEIPSYEAEEFVGRKFTGPYPFSGERFANEQGAQLSSYSRAEYVS